MAGELEGWATSNFIDFSERNRGPVAEFPEPSTLADLVRAVREAESRGLPVHAVGSGWAFSAPCYTYGYLVKTHRLNQPVSWLQDAVLRPLSDPHPHVAVEAGIKVRDLYLVLSGHPSDPATGGFGVSANPAVVPPAWLNPPVPPPGAHPPRILAPPTLGGAGRQSIAGVVSTGTHGGDAARPPITDYVQALILVGSGGGVRVVERAGVGVLNMAAVQSHLETLLAGIVPAVAVEVLDTSRFPSVVMSVGRFGVVYAYVFEVHDESGQSVFEHRHIEAWEDVAGLTPGVVATLPGKVNGAVANDEFLGLLISSRARDDGKHDCMITRHALAATGASVFGFPPNSAAWVMDVRARAAWSPEIGQIFCAGEMTPEVQALQAALIAVAVLVLLFGPVAGAAGIEIPLADVVAELGAIVVAAALFEAAAILGRIGPRYVLGDAVADILNLATHLGAAQLATMVQETVIQGAQPDHLDANAVAPGSPAGPWLVHGTRGEISDFFDYHNDCYRGDSVEMFFPASQLPQAITMVLGVFDEGLSIGTPVLGYIAARVMAGSSATLATAAWPTTCSIEVSMLRGVEGNAFALRELQRRTLGMGGRVHWGQENDLLGPEVEAVYGGALTTFHQDLHACEGPSLTFSNDFSRQHGLDLPHNAIWDPAWKEARLIAGAGACAVDASHGQPMTVVAADADGHLFAAARPSGQAPEVMPMWRPLPPDPLAVSGAGGVGGSPVALRGSDGLLRVFGRATSGSFPDRLRHVDEEAAGGAFGSWDTIGSFADLSGGPRIERDPALGMHSDGRLEVFGVGADSVTQGQLMHGWQQTPNGWWTSFGPMGRGTRLASAPSSCLRQHVEGVSVTDQLIVVAVDEGGTVHWSGQTGPGGASGWTDWAELHGRDGHAMHAAAAGPHAVLAPGPPARPRVLAISTAGQVWECVDDDRTVAITWESWQQLPELTPSASAAPLDPQIGLATALNTSLWLFGVTLLGELVTISLAPGSGWGAWTNLRGGFRTKPSAAALDNGLIEVAIRRTEDNMLMVRRQTSPTTW